MKNYQYKNLTNKYTLLSEGAYLTLRKEMFKEDRWDHKQDRPVAECWTESGEIKHECWAQTPGSTTSEPGYAGTAGGESIGEDNVPEMDAPSSFKGSAEELVHHLRRAEASIAPLTLASIVLDVEELTTVKNMLVAIVELQRMAEMIESTIIAQEDSSETL